VDPRCPLAQAVRGPGNPGDQSDPHTFILRVSKAVSFEAPFIFLLFGNERAVLFDTGPSADPVKIPLRRTVDELVAAWLAEHPREEYELVIAHTHGHHDHRDGDPQFADRPRTAVVGHTAEEVRSFYGFSQWPGQVVSFDLGGRVLELTGTPGHHYPAGSTYQPDEVPLRLPAGRIAEIRNAARAGAKPGVYAYGDFIIWNGGQRLAPMLGQAFRLIAYNRANRKQARRG
jgi:Metallo-beta-lactamase superfamily